MEFATLVASQIQEGSLRNEIERLTRRKIAGDELTIEPRITEINEYLEERITYYSEYTKTFATIRPDIERLDTVLRRTLDRS